MSPRAILHVDMDAFYASVEQLDRPDLRGRPVVVGADPKAGRGRGVVCACSYEARAHGIRSALPISQAWRLCPQAVYLRPRFARYQEVSKQVFSILGRYTDLVEPLSIDEAFLDVSGSQRMFGDAADIGRAIKAAVREELGLVASVGVAPNKFVAKIASDLRKPDGFVAVSPADVEPFLAPLPVGRLWGVGPKTAERLTRVGVRTIGDVARLRPRDLEALLGDPGADLWRLAHGLDDRPVVPEAEPRSLGAETTFERDTGDPEVILRTLLDLADRVAMRLRRQGYVARGVALKFRDASFATATRAAALPRPTDLGEDIHRAVLGLLPKVFAEGRRVRLVGVTATRLLSARAASNQTELFRETEERRALLARTVDAIRERFGIGAITRGALVGDPGEASRAERTANLGKPLTVPHGGGTRSKQ